MSDQTPRDVEAIRAHLDAATPAPWHKDDGDFGCVTIGDYGWTTPPGVNGPEYDVDSPQGHADAELIAHAPTDLRRLLDENARLNAENDDMRKRVAYAAAVVSGDAAEMLADSLAKARAELDRVIRESAADKAKLAELEGSTCQACGERTVRLQTEAGGSWTHHDGVNCWNRCADNPGKVWPQAAPGNEGWRGAYMHAQTLLEEAMRRIDALEPAPEMPHPPAVDALGAVETPGADSGSGTGVAEAQNSRQAIDWPNVDGWTLSARPGGILLSHDTDAERPLLLSDERLPLGAVLAFIEVEQPEEDDEVEPDLSLIPAELIKSDPGIRGGEPCITGTRVPAHEVAGYLADGATWDEVREILPSLPSLPVPSTERPTP